MIKNKVIELWSNLRIKENLIFISLMYSFEKIFIKFIWRMKYVSIYDKIIFFIKVDDKIV